MSLPKKMGFFLLAFVLFLPLPLRAATAFDHSAWDAFLKEFVNSKGEVRYQAIVKDPKPLDNYLAALMQVKQSEFASWPREETLAFWLNAYHAMLVKLVTEHYPVKSVQHIPGFWDVAAFHFGKSVAGEGGYSLNDIRMNKLIGVYRDEKIDLALCLAAKGGPPMAREAFTGPRVEGQLFLLTRQFVNDPANVDITPGKKKIFLSRLFKWYGNDFKLDFGTIEPLGKFSIVDTSVISFLSYYLEDDAKGEYLQQAGYKIEYPSFDWSLNDQKEASA